MSVSGQRVSVIFSQCQVNIYVRFMSIFPKMWSFALVHRIQLLDPSIQCVGLKLVSYKDILVPYKSVSLLSKSVVSKIVWLCNQKLLVSLNYVLIYVSIYSKKMYQ